MAINVAKLEAEVKGPGRFEGEPVWAAYYWNQVMNGDGETICCDDSDDEEAFFDGFIVDAEESEAFGLEIGSWVGIHVDSQGFIVTVNRPSRDDLERYINRYFGR